MQAATSNRTFICSVVFLDIVEYSKKPVAEQIAFKERLNNMLSEALSGIAPNDRIILDTGDGAALSFLGDPEDALFASLSLRDALAGPQPSGPEMKMRIGINLGPVKLIKDINGQPNIIGDGINVAQRVMSFSQPSQILASRSYYEVVSRMSSEFAQLFHFEGSRTDKHVREHEVYSVQSTGAPLRRPARPKGETSSSTPLIIDKLTHSASIVTTSLRRKPRLGTALAVVSILAISVGLRVHRHVTAPAAAEPAPPAKTAAASPQPVPVVEAVKTPAPAAKEPAVTEKTPVATGKQTEEKKTETPKPAAVEYVLVSFAIAPWGEIYVNDTKRGVAPPMRELALKPGRYKIEIRNADFAPHVEVIEVKPGSRIKIRHKFR